jgi:hypothetical protein
MNAGAALLDRGGPDAGRPGVFNGLVQVPGGTSVPGGPASLGSPQASDLWSHSIAFNALTPLGPGVVAEPLPAGVWIRAAQESQASAKYRSWLYYNVASRLDLFRVVIGYPGAPSVPIGQVAEFCRLIPAALWPEVRFARFGPVTRPDGEAVAFGQALADLVDQTTIVGTGVRIMWADPGGGSREGAMLPDGAMTWMPFAMDYGYTPRSLTEGIPVDPVAVDAIAPITGLAETRAGVFPLGDDTVLEVVQSGLWLRPGRTPAGAAAIRAAVADPQNANLIYDTSTKPSSARMARLAVEVLQRIGDGTRAAIRLLPAHAFAKSTAAGEAADDRGARRALRGAAQAGETAAQPAEASAIEEAVARTAIALPAAGPSEPGQAAVAGYAGEAAAEGADSGAGPDGAQITATVAGGPAYAGVPAHTGVPPQAGTATMPTAAATTSAAAAGSGAAGSSGVAGSGAPADPGGAAGSGGLAGPGGAANSGGAPSPDNAAADPAAGPTWSAEQPPHQPPQPPSALLRLESGMPASVALPGRTGDGPAPAPHHPPAPDSTGPGASAPRSQRAPGAGSGSASEPDAKPGRRAESQTRPEAAGPNPASPRVQTVPTPQSCAIPPDRGLAAEHAWFRRSLPERYDAEAGSIARLLAETPGLRSGAGDTVEHVITDLVAARLYLAGNTRAFDDTVRSNTVGAHVPLSRCIMSGLRRLPSHRGATRIGATLRPDERQWYADRRTVTEWSFCPALAGGRLRPPGTTEVLIWSVTARRTALLDPDLPEQVVFLPGTNFSVLGVEEGEHPRILLRELAAGEEGAGTAADRAAASRKVLDEMALRGLEQASESWQESPDGPGPRAATAIAAGRFAATPGLIVSAAPPAGDGRRPR